MKQKISKIWKYGFLLFLSLSTLVYLINSYHFLSINRPVKPDILVVEGWLPEDALKLASQEFIRSRYKLLITTGFPYWNGFQMGQDGKIVFLTHHTIHSTPDSLYAITLIIRGTSCLGKYAHYQFFADTVMIGNQYSTRHKKLICRKAKLPSPPYSIMMPIPRIVTGICIFMVSGSITSTCLRIVIRYSYMEGGRVNIYTGGISTVRRQ
jgi:hypothetical protein